MDTKSLSLADLGIKESSNISHIGLTETMIPLSDLESEDREYEALLFIEGQLTPYYTSAYINAIKDKQGVYRSPKLKTGGRGIEEGKSLLKLIRKHAVKNNKTEYHKLTLGLATDKIIAYLHNSDKVGPTQANLFKDSVITDTVIAENKIIKDFSKDVILYLLDNHNEKFQGLLVQNPTSAEHLDLGSLTRIIRTSKLPLTKQDLSLNDKLRYFEEPINNDPLWYLSGEWYGNNSIKLLCFNKLKKIIEKHFPHYFLKQEGETYHFIHQTNTSALIVSDNYNVSTSLLTKPFTILTGASGTGKTKLAESLAEHYRNHSDVSKATNVAIVPVGADWTDNRNVLGFVNHLRDTGPEGAKQPIYQSTPVLDLLLEATQPGNEGTPHFLILDEMNLSHVERYFADFLSTMEQTDGKLYLHDEGPDRDDTFTLPRYEDDPTGVPRSISYPDNLYVIGTVNIDETTYMFSPKVLDRANVIEFKVEHQDISGFLDSPGNYPETEQAAEGAAEAFHSKGMKARNGRYINDLTAPVHAEIKGHLLNLFDIMQEGRFEFAYRTAKEVMHYTSVCRHLSDDKTVWDNITGNEGWKSDLDDQVLQKILPKLHGSIGRVGPLLASLADYCHQGKAVDGDKGLKAILELEPQTAEFKKSFTKLQSMIRTLLDEQFVSFIQ